MILRRWENIHIYFWLLKDICWITEFKPLGVFMIIPTLSLAVWLTWKYRGNLSELVHNTAVCLWISANSLWMIGEFFFHDTIRIYPKVLFLLGIGLITLYYLYRLYVRLVGGRRV